MRPECFYSCDTQLIRTTNREREAVAGEAARMIGFEDQIGGGVVRVWIHGIGPVEELGSRKPEIVGLQRYEYES